MKLNIFQQSIAKTRRKMHRANQLASKMVRDIRSDEERTNTNLEMFLDDLAAEGVEISKENLPTIAAFITQFVEHQQRRKEELAGGGEGMEDHLL